MRLGIKSFGKQFFLSIIFDRINKTLIKTRENRCQKLQFKTLHWSLVPIGCRSPVN